MAINLKNSVVILGAGASKGALVSGGRTPPLDAEFLAAAADLFRSKRARGKNRAMVVSWNSFKRHLAGAGLKFREVKGWRLEQLSTFLEARANLRGLQLGRGQPRDYAQALEALKIMVCHVLNASGGTRNCSLHEMLFKSIFPKAVISFNYDLIADQSLLELEFLNWRSAEYRCARHVGVPLDRGRTAFKPITSRIIENDVPLIKLHGSIHYERLRRGSGFRLSGIALPEGGHKRFEFSRVPKRPYLIPPVAAKIEIKQKALRERWYSAVDHLYQANSWLIWGYSFPQTYTIAHVLFRTALARNRKSKRVVVIDPDMSVAERVREICQKVNVHQYPSMERFLLDQGAIPAF